MPKTNVSRWEKVVSWAESFFSAKQKLFIGLGLLVCILGLGYSSLVGQDPSSATVMITNLAQNSGGSGVVLSSSTTESTVLTNAHVCKVAEKGGYVINSNKESFLIESYSMSSTHDICAVKVKVDLGVSADIASTPPSKYDSALVSGHPSLLPNVLSKGHFGEKKVIYLMSGSRVCTKEDTKDLTKALYCMFFGGKLPIFTPYESLVVTAMVKPGSSGSAVYNYRNQISGLVFAGSGRNLSYAFIVPHEYVADFVNNPDRAIKYTPNYQLEIEDMMNLQLTTYNTFSEDVKHFKKKCNLVGEATGKEISKVCEKINRNSLWVEE